MKKYSLLEEMINYPDKNYFETLISAEFNIIFEKTLNETDRVLYYLKKNNYSLEAKLLLVFFLPFLVECLFSEFVNIYSTLFLFAVLFIVDIF